MLNTRALGDLLTRNRDDQLCKRWFLMTPNGTLLSYSRPTDIKDLRQQAAMAATTWQEHDDESTRTDDGEPETPGHENGMSKKLHTLTIETEASNFLLRRLQPQLLLVLDGGAPRRRSTFESRVTAEGPEDDAYPAAQNGGTGEESSANNSSASSFAESTMSTATINILAVQRKRLEAMAAAIAEYFERTGFQMPDDDGIKLF